MKVKLWTIQDETTHTAFISEGVFRGSEEFVPSYSKEGYNWMKTQMQKRIGPPKEITQYPVWAWYQSRGAHSKRPDLRESCHLPKGTVGYRLEFEKEEDKVLLSDFEMWHSPLAHQYFIADSESEAVDFESELIKRFNTSSFFNLPHAIRMKIKKSWEKIFDLDFDVDYYTKPFDQKCIQATFWELHLNEVVKVDRFTAR